MQKIIVFLLFALSTHLLNSQNTAHFQNSRTNGAPSYINPEWAPFFHGVASGDPLSDRVIIWTRVTPEEMNEGSIDVEWRVATDPALANIVQSGTFTTDATRDYTVKVDVSGLAAGTTYYYGFTALSQNSLTGRTRTTPAADQSGHLKFGVVSCSNYQGGYFNGYGRLAERNDLDAVIHLGDYIYENGNFSYGDSTIWDDRLVEPGTEIVSLAEYRTRYSTYRLDTNLIRVHQQHPFITVWDDHETANDAYRDGAQNHQEETEGEWEVRKANGKQAYFEWLPIRDNEDQRVYRSISYGNLMDLIMLDTRLEGREIQINNVLDSALLSEERTILGQEQKAWLKDQLVNSSARWKVIGQQVIFSEINLGWSALALPGDLDYFALESLFLDIWDGYPAERAEILSFIDTNNIDNVVVLTGDFHTTFAFDVAPQPTSVSFQEIPGVGTLPIYSSTDYDPESGAASLAVEFACPSVTSANFDENIGALAAFALQVQVNTPLMAPGTDISLGNPNPHLKYTDFVQHGYYILDLKADSAQADYFFTPINEVTDTQVPGESWYTQDGSNHLVKAAAVAAPKEQQDEPAPAQPPLLDNVDGTLDTRDFAILGVYPNPFNQQNVLHYSLSKAAPLRIDLYNQAGTMVRQLVRENMPAGIYSVQMDAEGLSSGAYFYRIQIGEKVRTVQVVVQ